jgi:hypothetical protein
MVLLATKLKNQLITEAEKAGIAIEVKLKNITLNGVKRGCSGHVVSEDSCVYLTTEELPYLSLLGRAMYRLSNGPGDYSSNGLINGNNRWCDHNKLAAAVIKTLKNEKPIKRQ